MHNETIQSGCRFFPIRLLLILLLSLGISSLSVFKAQAAGAVTAFEGARLISGDDNAPIRDSVFVVEGNRITAVGRRGQVAVPDGATRVNLRGKTVMPAIIDAHKHNATERDRLIAQLRQLASYGVGAVLSLGQDDTPAPHQVRKEIIPGAARYFTAGRGITMPEPGRAQAAYGTEPAAHWITSVEEGREVVREEAAKGVDFIKIWVDDRGGRYDKMTPAMYSAIIAEAHLHDVPVAAHIYNLEDAKGLLRAGIDVFAHGVRDRDVDAELIQLFHQHPEVIVVPNLPDEGVSIDMRGLKGLIPDEVVATVEADYAGTAEDREFYQIQARNLDALNRAGVPIAFGTDGREMWEVFIELENMVAAGMTPAEVITAATRNSAIALGLRHTGTLAAGNSADFIVLDANPLEDIVNTRRIHSVYLRGERVQR